MSGGHFNHNQYNIDQIADEIEYLVNSNDSEDVNEWGDRVGHGFSPEVIVKFREAVNHLRRAYVYAQRIDWLVSGDDGEDQFHRRLERELAEIDSGATTGELERRFAAENAKREEKLCRT